MREEILVALILYWCLHMIMQHVLGMQALAFNEEWENTLILSICFESVRMSGHSVRAFERNAGLTDGLLLGSSMEKTFKQKNCIFHNTFKVLWKSLGLYL